MPKEKVEAPMAGKILSVETTVGSRVERGDTICVLESMKMENLVMAPVAGTIQEIKVAAAQVVQTYDVIAIIDY
ncbi:MAG: biotin/lipoyl-containing protein [Dehalococcoidia bacterium]|nr:biotin/lipoyl-containing protein [Dehalococcoidia bacterium]